MVGRESRANSVENAPEVRMVDRPRAHRAPAAAPTHQNRISEKRGPRVAENQTAPEGAMSSATGQTDARPCERATTREGGGATGRGKKPPPAPRATPLGCGNHDFLRLPNLL